MAKRTTGRAPTAASKTSRSGRTTSKAAVSKTPKRKTSRAGTAKTLGDRAVVYPVEAEGGRVVVRERSGTLPEDVLTALLGTGDLSGGSRTTLRVPETLEREVTALSKELGLTKNDALVRLAFAGSQLVDRARETARKRESRRAAVFASTGDKSGDLPTVEEMQEAAFVLRNGDD